MSMDRASQRAVRVAKALGDPTRFDMLRRIAAAGEINCRDLTTLFPVSQATVSHHLKVLTDAGLVQARRQGQFHYFSLRPEALEAHASALERALGARSRRPGEGRPTPRSKRRSHEAKPRKADRP
jgi:ArsR family transcriptional regulator